MIRHWVSCRQPKLPLLSSHPKYPSHKQLNQSRKIIGILAENSLEIGVSAMYTQQQWQEQSYAYLASEIAKIQDFLHETYSKDVSWVER